MCTCTCVTIFYTDVCRISTTATRNGESRTSEASNRKQLLVIPFRSTSKTSTCTCVDAHVHLHLRILRLLAHSKWTRRSTGTGRDAVPAPAQPLPSCFVCPPSIKRAQVTHHQRASLILETCWRSDLGLTECCPPLCWDSLLLADSLELTVAMPRCSPIDRKSLRAFSRILSAWDLAPITPRWPE